MPTYNHTRGDSPLTPCPQCLQEEPLAHALLRLVDGYIYAMLGRAPTETETLEHLDHRSALIEWVRKNATVCSMSTLEHYINLCKGKDEEIMRLNRELRERTERKLGGVR